MTLGLFATGDTALLPASLLRLGALGATGAEAAVTKAAAAAARREWAVMASIGAEREVLAAEQRQRMIEEQVAPHIPARRRPRHPLTLTT